MPQPRVLILRAPGTNCDQETAFAFTTAGARAEVVHLNRLLENPGLPNDYQILCLPGGFSYGDDLGAGRIFANQLRHHLEDTLREFRAREKLILGICNGFQVLVKTGLLLEDAADGPQSTLAWNTHGRFEDRWVDLRVAYDRCVFLQGIERMYLPIAHAEGRFMVRHPGLLETLEQTGQLVLRYCDTQGNYNSPLPFPANPNGAQANVAGLADRSGRIFGLMPHPERHIDRTQHPRWTRGEGRDPGDGLAIFRNAVRYFSG